MKLVSQPINISVFLFGLSNRCQAWKHFPAPRQNFPASVMGSVVGGFDPDMGKAAPVSFKTSLEAV
jgi:hypothetical protein